MLKIADAFDIIPKKLIIIRMKMVTVYKIYYPWH